MRWAESTKRTSEKSIGVSNEFIDSRIFLFLGNSGHPARHVPDFTWVERRTSIIVCTQVETGNFIQHVIITFLANQQQLQTYLGINKLFTYFGFNYEIIH